MYTYKEILFRLQKKENSDTYHNPNVPGTHSKRNNSATKGLMLYDFTYTTYPGQSDAQRQKVEWLIPGARGRGVCERLWNGFGISVREHGRGRVIEWCDAM